MNNFLTQLAVAFPPEKWRDVTTLVAVSGGADSVALLRGLVLLKQEQGEGRLVAAHFNHRLRGEESDADEAFVRRLAQELGVGLEVGSGDVRAAASGDGLEAAARTARYAFLTETAQRSGARYVATAHSSDDQVETVLHRILRGTGISGLAGIPRARELAPGLALVRPLLGISRADVTAFLSSLNQSYRDDSSNLELSFTRNRIRHSLLPYLEREFAPDVREALLRLAKLAEENQQYLDAQVGPLVSQRVKQRGSGVVLDCADLDTVHRHLVRELLIYVWSENHWSQQQMTLEKWDQLAALAQESAARSTAQSLPGGIRAERKGNELWLTPP